MNRPKKINRIGVEWAWFRKGYNSAYENWKKYHNEEIEKANKKIIELQNKIKRRQNEKR